MIHPCTPSTQAAEVEGQPGLHSKFVAILGYKERAQEGKKEKERGEEKRLLFVITITAFYLPKAIGLLNFPTISRSFIIPNSIRWKLRVERLNQCQLNECGQELKLPLTAGKTSV